ncbi:hypothetical protein BH09BAC5_BH09BAC5_08890 [soil metagenome]
MKLSFACLLPLLFMFMFILPSCSKHDQKSELENVFEKWTERTDKLKLNSFKSSPIDSTGKNLEIVATIIDSIYKDISQNAKLNMYVDSVFSCEIYDRRIRLGIAFHTYLNGGDILGPEVLSKSEDIMVYNVCKKIERNEVENEKIAIGNYQSIKIGDSLSLIFPVKNNYGHQCTFFYNGYPYSYDYSQADDSLTLKVILAGKFRGGIMQSSIDSTSLYFKVQIVQLGDTNVRILSSDKKYRVGEQFDFCLQSYGRIIN